MRLLFLLSTQLSLHPLAAQHCGYDFTALIVVHPHIEGDTTTIGGLRVTLLDSNNVPVIHHGRALHLFLPNTDPEACHRGTDGFGRGRKFCFPFAGDNYVLVVPRGWRTEKMKVLVQDDRQERWDRRGQGREVTPYRQRLVPLTASDSWPLCGRYDDEVYPMLEGRTAYHPVDIILQEE
ncbi:MAG TPA: hypothetical protein VGE21_08670 [Flavobacteriales bacterium]